MKKIFLLIITTLLAYSTTILEPTDTIEINGTAKDMVLRDNSVIVATDEGHIEIFNIENNITKVKDISIPTVKDFMGDTIPARVMSTDKINDRYLILSDSGKGGYSNLYIYDNNLTQLLTAKDKRAIIKARFIDKEHILLGYLSNEVGLFDIKSKKEIYRVQLSESKFSDFALNEKRTEVIFSCESGVLNLVDVKSGKVLKELKGQNVDNVYRVDFKNRIISGAGQDQRGSLYDVSTGKGSYIKGSFLIYGTALSPSGKRVAFSMDEKNNISIYDTLSKSKTHLLKGQKSTLNVIIFKDEDIIYSASDDNSIMVWNLNKK